MIEPILELAAERYGLSRSHLSPLSGGHFSHVYRFSRDGKDYVLKITPPNDEIDLQAMRAILDWIRFLAVHGAAVASPIHSKRHQFIEPIEHNGQTYQVVVFEAAQGILSEKLSPEQWTGTLYQNLGRTVGKMHALAQSYIPAKASSRRPEWDQTSNYFNPPHNPDPGLAPIYEKREKLLSSLQALPKDKESYGLIHSDLHFGNFFVDVDTCRITIFDFDDCIYGWYLMDTAMLLFDLLVLYSGADKETFAIHFMRNYLRGYGLEKSLSAFWISQLPLFLKLLEIGVYLELCPEYEPHGSDSWPDKFMPGRQQRIENDIPYLNLDFDHLLESDLLRR